MYWIVDHTNPPLHIVKNSTFYRQFREELVGAGLLALTYAARSYKPDLGFKFTTYAHRCVSFACWRLCSLYAKRYLSEDRGRGEVVLDGFQSYDGRSADNPELTLDTMDCYEFATILMLHVLKDKERDVLIRHAMHGVTLKDIGIDYGVCRERARQIYVAAIGKMRKAMEEHGVVL